jgi:hypothetical protein
MTKEAEANGEVSIRKGRGKGVKPAFVHVNIRIPVEVLEFFKMYPSYTAEMRRVLTYYALVNGQLEGRLRDSDIDR